MAFQVECPTGEGMGCAEPSGRFSVLSRGQRLFEEACRTQEAPDPGSGIRDPRPDVVPASDAEDRMPGSVGGSAQFERGYLSCPY